MVALRDRADGSSVAELLDAVLRETGYIDALEAERTIEAEGRVENLQELVGVAGEFDANRASRARATPPLDEFLAQISLLSDQDSMRDGESLVTLMTPPQRQGPRVRGRLPDRLRGGRLPALALDRGGQPRGGAPALLRRPHPRQQRLYLTCARHRNLYGGTAGTCRRGSSGSCPRNWSSGTSAPRHRLVVGPRDLVGRRAARDSALNVATRRRGFFAPREEPSPPLVSFSIGDDVIHASFGEGVVTSVEPGSVVVVRFAGDGAERKLMADYAPLSKGEREVASAR